MDLVERLNALKAAAGRLNGPFVWEEPGEALRVVGECVGHLDVVTGCIDEILRRKLDEGADPGLGEGWGMGPLREVCQVERYQTSSHPHGAWSVELRLECGHTIRRKSSDYGGGRVHCGLCQVADWAPRRRTR